MEESMNAFISLFEQRPEQDTSETAAEEVEEYSAAQVSICEPDDLTEEQIRGLVRQVFLPGWPKPARHVVFSPVDETTEIASLCRQVGQALSVQVSGTACVVEANCYGNGPGEQLGLDLVCGPARSGSLRDSCHQLSDNLWQVPLEVFLGEEEDGLSADGMRRRLEELRLEFDYTIIQGPAAGLHSEAPLLGHLCDGIILVLQANSTRRMAALKVKERLRLAKARLLGTVLTERTFPIPDAIYKRL